MKNKNEHEVSIRLRLSAELKREIEQTANNSNRSTNSMILFLIESGLSKESINSLDLESITSKIIASSAASLSREKAIEQLSLEEKSLLKTFEQLPAKKRTSFIKSLTLCLQELI